jgi:hypothetical protein
MSPPYCLKGTKAIMQRLSNIDAEALLVKTGVIENQPALRAAHRLHEFYHPFEASELVEQFAQSEVEKVQKSIAGER